MCIRDRHLTAHSLRQGRLQAEIGALERILAQRGDVPLLIPKAYPHAGLDAVPVADGEVDDLLGVCLLYTSRCV